MSRPAGRRRLPLVAKVLIGVAVLVVGALLFLQSLRSTRAEPYRLERVGSVSWTIVVESAAQPGDPVLVARGPQELVSTLFRQVFNRMMESLNAPATASIPILLRRELDGVPAPLAVPEALLKEARASGLDGEGAFRPRCMAHRRISQPGATRQVYFAVFESAAFEHFRRGLAARMASAGAPPSIDPDALSPVMFVAASDVRLSSWLPLRVDEERDCVAPIVAE